MSWLDSKVIVLRASNYDDPEVSYVEVWIGVTWCTPVSSSDGNVTEYWDGERVRSPGAYWSISVKTRGFTTVAGDPLEAPLQDYGVLQYLEYLLTAFEYKWLYATYERGSDPAMGPIRRAGQHIYHSSGLNDCWTTTVGLPLRVELKGDLKPEDDEEVGGTSASFVLESSFPRPF